MGIFSRQAAKVLHDADPHKLSHLQHYNMHYFVPAGVTGTWRLIGSPVTQDGKNFMRIDRFEVSPEVETLKVHANNLFKGNQELSKFRLMSRLHCKL